MNTLRQTSIAFATPEPDREDARQNARQRVLKAGRIICPGHRSTFDVMIRDMSVGGVRLKLPETFIVPTAFELIILNTNTGVQESRPCVKRWQHSLLVGAEFQDTLEIAARAN